MSLRCIGELLYDLFYSEDNYPTEEQLPKLKELIKHLWYNVYLIQDLMRYKSAGAIDVDYFNPYLEFVNFEDIPEWDNAESIYIPMFDDAEIIVR